MVTLIACKSHFEDAKTLAEFACEPRQPRLSQVLHRFLQPEAPKSRIWREFRVERGLGYSPPAEDASETLSGLVVEVEIRSRSGGERRQML